MSSGTNKFKFIKNLDMSNKHKETFVIILVIDRTQKKEVQFNHLISVRNIIDYSGSIITPTEYLTDVKFMFSSIILIPKTNLMECFIKQLYPKIPI